MRSPAFLFAIGIVVTICLALVVVITLLRTGDARAVSDNMPLKAAVVALVGVGIAQMLSTSGLTTSGNIIDSSVDVYGNPEAGNMSISGGSAYLGPYHGSVMHQGPRANGAAYFNPGIGKAGITCTKTLAGGGNVQNFVNNLKSGQVGCLHGGTYTSPNHVKLSGSGYTLAGYPGEKAVYRGGFNFKSSSNVTLQGFTVNASYAPVSTSNGRTNTAQAANLGSSSGAVLGSMVLMNRRGPDHSGTCVFGGTSNGAQIRASWIHTCGQAPAGEGEHGIYIGNKTSGMLVKNTWVNDVQNTAWKFTQRVSNNHFVGVVADKVDRSTCCNYAAVLFNDRPTGNLMEKSVVRGVPNHATVTVAPGHSGSNNTVQNNCLWPVMADKKDSNVTMSNNVVADPQISGFKVTNPNCYAQLPLDSPFRP